MCESVSPGSEGIRVRIANGSKVKCLNGENKMVCTVYKQHIRMDLILLHVCRKDRYVGWNFLEYLWKGLTCSMEYIEGKNDFFLIE